MSTRACGSCRSSPTTTRTWRARSPPTASSGPAATPRASPTSARSVAALTVARYPMNVFYNAGKAAEMTDEYNWIYTTKASGGSGICENNPAPPACPRRWTRPPATRTTSSPGRRGPPSRTSWATTRGRTYVHQSNLAEERILYPVLDKVLDALQGAVRRQRPDREPAEKDTGTELPAGRPGTRRGRRPGHRLPDRRRRHRAGAQGRVRTRHRAEGTRKQLFVGTTAFGTAYAGLRSDWSSPELLQSATTLQLPATPTA